MRRWQIAMWVILACGASAAAGFWLGFREAWTLGVAADLLPRGARSVAQLEAVQAGRIRPVTLGLEFDVDNGLSWGYVLVNHPLRDLWRPLWGLEVLPGYERYLTRLADYRRDHPSSTRGDMFSGAPQSRPDAQESQREFARFERELVARRDRMVERYATKKGPSQPAH
jgi:hypothetical protein